MAQRIKSRRRKAVKKQAVHDVFWTGNAIQYQFL